jgi:hypothetical protein
MIALLAVPAIYLTALQGIINGPRDAFRNCLREASAKATTEKVAGGAFEAWVRTACAGQLSTLRTTVIGFNMKNGMARKDAASDADLTVDDYVASSVDHYKFMAEVNTPEPAKQAAAPPPTVPATPAAVPQPPK